MVGFLVKCERIYIDNEVIILNLTSWYLILNFSVDSDCHSNTFVHEFQEKNHKALTMTSLFVDVDFVAK